MELDVPSMAMMVSLATFAVGLALIAFGYQRQFAGLVPWGWGLFCFALAAPLLALRDVLPSGLIVPAGGVLLHLSIALMLLGLYQHFGRRPDPWVIGVPLPLAALIFAFLHDYPARLVWVSLLLAVQLVSMLVLLYAHRRQAPGRGLWLVMTGAGIALAVALWRVGAVEFGWVELTSYTAPGILQALSHATLMFSLLLVTIGFMGMLHEGLEARYVQLASTDVLTGVHNRRALMDAFYQELAGAVRRRAPLCLLMIDIDHFKQVNDRHGHQAGDAVLRALAQAMKVRLRAQDLLGRYGGEEFLALLPDTDVAGGLRVADSLRTRVEGLLVHHEGSDIRVTISIGVHAWVPGMPEDSIGLVRDVDAALYAAKHNGRNRVEAFVAAAGMAAGEEGGAPDRN